MCSSLHTRIVFITCISKYAWFHILWFTCPPGCTLFLNFLDFLTSYTVETLYNEILVLSWDQDFFLLYQMHTCQLSLFKDVIRNRFNFILEERVKFSEQNSENLMKIGWKIRKLWNFEISQIFKKQFLTSRYEYANERVDDVIASQFSIHFVYRNDKNFIFQLREC